MQPLNPIVAFLGTLPQFATSRQHQHVLDLRSGCVVDSVLSTHSSDVHMFMLRVRWPAGGRDVEHFVEANKFVEYHILKAHQMGMDANALRTSAERAFSDIAAKWAATRVSDDKAR